jgi:putative transposase
MRTVEQDADAIGETKFDALPGRVQDALGELAGAAKEGLLALSVGVGLGVLSELMAEEVDDVVGPKGRHDAERSAVRHGHEPGEVTLGGRRVPVERPRVRAADGSGEVALATYAHFADRDPLTKVVLEQMLAGVSTRRFARTREPVGQDVVDAERSASKSAVSREFVGRTGEHLTALMSRSLADVRLAALMLDGLELKGRCCVVALGVTTDGVKVPLGLWDGSTENKRVCVELLVTSSTAAWTAIRACSSSWTAARRCGPPSTPSSATSPSSVAFATRNATCSITSPSATGPPSSGGCARPGS